MMIRIDPERCIGCGRCQWDCFPGAISMERGISVLASPENCIGCGHCIAVCPVEAVTDDSLDMTEAAPAGCNVEADTLLALMRSRRSCRHFTQEAVPEQLVQRIIDAARACPTAKNLQATRYIVVTDHIPELLDAALSALGDLGERMLKTELPADEKRRAENFLRWQKTRRRDREFDPLFFHAPLLLLFVSPMETARDAAGAAAYGELMAAASGLGCLYSGYFTACAAASPEIQQLLELEAHEQAVRCLVLGWPDIRFLRTAPRKQPNIKRL